MNYQETIEYINSYTKSGKPIKNLNRIATLLEALGNPQKDLKFIHVAGTNGKGSTVEMIANTLTLSKYTVGSFTSPYMFCYEDRIRVNGKNITKEALCNLAQVVKDAIKGNEYSQFEVTMAIAFLYFKSVHCDMVVLETGIGGLVDSTNIVQNTLISVITSISFDHVAVLGNTLEEIAYQKAGIIKPNRPAILSVDNTNGDVIRVVTDYANSMNSKLTIPEVPTIMNFSKYGEEFLYRGDTYHVKMIGEHQVANAINVIEVCNLLNTMGYSISKEVLKQSLASTQVPFRTQLIVQDGVTMIVDGSHNVDGVTALKRSLKLCGVSQPIVLTGMISTKDYVSCSSIINSFAKEVVCTDGYIYNAIDSQTLSKLFTVNTHTIGLCNALEYAKSIAKREGSVLVVCGSLYLLSSLF